MSYSVGQVAAFAGVTVRTLHHYDKAGLLSPGERSHAGYRLYGDADLARLQQILFYRELGFSLDEIASILADPQANAQGDLGLDVERVHRVRTVQRDRREPVAHLVQ
ncbi:MerR family transcriptional regulator, partial [Streptomyces sp. NPDC049577]|uniref:MerR family transcriptional regulator n=1 Tax=Streptomyces sp. NPDC049577 TaxID=3155153 RepID=UPI003415C8C0